MPPHTRRITFIHAIVSAISVKIRSLGKLGSAERIAGYESAQLGIVVPGVAEVVARLRIVTVIRIHQVVADPRAGKNGSAAVGDLEPPLGGIFVSFQHVAAVIGHRRNTPLSVPVIILVVDPIGPQDPAIIGPGHGRWAILHRHGVAVVVIAIGRQHRPAGVQIDLLDPPSERIVAEDRGARRIGHLCQPAQGIIRVGIARERGQSAIAVPGRRGAAHR